MIVFFYLEKKLLNITELIKRQRYQWVWPKRVIDTIAEQVLNVAVGAAMNGLRPIVEFMTWNFAVLASFKSSTTQLNASNERWSVYSSYRFQGS